ncbi:hypothetical protein BYT27DRAFT_7109423 [Phlegmacium glaucopus]|nr:hypothetical protein BYT27DRAFT_7109423 [Phlegmacium glaucopus]
MNSQIEAQRSMMQEIRDLSPHLLKAAVTTFIPDGLMVPGAFWAGLTESQVAIGYRACLLLWVVSDRRLVPRQFQLEATIAIMEGRDSVIDVGTGSGKTICSILPCLLDPKGLSIVITPLKCLQAVQVIEVARYGIEALAINEDTPHCPELWKHIQEGRYKLLLVQPEQLSTIDGHIPRMARLIGGRRFVTMIKRVHIDEAHTIYSAGIERYGLPAFRPAWGRLGEFRLKLAKNTAFQALSGTQPAHIKATIIEKLLIDQRTALFIKLTSNRPNTVYATHAIVGELKDFRNLDFLVPDGFCPPMRLAKTLIFHDNIEEAADAALHVDHRLPLLFQNRGIVQHYHGGMSPEYLTQVYEDFCDPNGKCLILHATEGASTVFFMKYLQVELLN